MKGQYLPEEQTSYAENYSKGTDSQMEHGESNLSQQHEQ